ncbi:MAG: hypothetical protein GY838_07735 [bacterium]|nr:hypothetical protein [bacterium]
MDGFIERLIRAIKLDATLYDEVDKDEGSMGQAVGVVALSSLAAGIGAAGLGGPFGILAGLLAALVGWFIWAFTAHFVGTRLLAEPQTRAELSQVLRATGFAAGPGLIRVLGIIPLLGILVNFVASLWMLAAFVVAIRQVLDYQSTGRAVAVCIIGFVIQFLVYSLFAVIGLGGLFMAAA